ncbi:MAG: Uma2 family endonuclease [Acidimicrobiales bacterium]
MALAQRRMTADEFLALPPDRRSQLIDGEIVVSDPVLRHNRIQMALYRDLADWLDTQPGWGEAGIGCNVRIDEQSVFVPDVWFVSEADRPGRDAKWFDRPPDLVAEVRSPSTWRYDTGTKKAAYFRTGVTELWLLDTETDTVLVFRRDESVEVVAGEQLTTPLLPGLAIDVAALFDR